MSTIHQMSPTTQAAWTGRLTHREDDTVAEDTAHDESTQRAQGRARRRVGWSERKQIERQRKKEHKAWLRQNFAEEMRKQQRARRHSGRLQKKLQAAEANGHSVGATRLVMETSHSQVEGQMSSGVDAADRSHPKWLKEEGDQEVPSLADIPSFEDSLNENMHEFGGGEGDRSGNSGIANVGNHNNPQSRYQVSTEWTASDQLTLSNSSYQEIALWRLSNYLFGVTPPELLPSREKVDLSDNDHHTEENFNEAVNLNWSSDFCHVFAELICLPWFHGRAELVQYAIQYALYCRLGNKSGRMPPSPDILYFGRNDRLVKALRDRQIAVHPDRLEDLILAITEVLGKDERVNAAFLDLVPNAVQQMKYGQLPAKQNIAKRDLYAIIDAWDTYVGRPENIVELKTATEYKEDLYSCHSEHIFGKCAADKEFIIEKVLAQKKEWILSQRKAAPSRGLEIPNQSSSSE